MRTSMPALAMTLGLAGCSGAPKLSVDDGYVRLAAVPRHPAAGYFTIHGGAADTTLLSISSDVAIKTEMHQSMSTGGPAGQAMSSMKPLDTLPVPARGEVRFAPGGRHLMLYDVNPGIVPGRRVKLTFVFSNGQRVTIFVPGIAAGAPAPAPG